jgi:hypothetical protein
MSNYCMHRNGSSRDYHAYFASPSGDADDVMPHGYQLRQQFEKYLLTFGSQTHCAA